MRVLLTSVDQLKRIEDVSLLGDESVGFFAVSVVEICQSFDEFESFCYFNRVIKSLKNHKILKVIRSSKDASQKYDEFYWVYLLKIEKILDTSNWGMRLDDDSSFYA